jgi:steroid 5-alpha reductase family enzyme
MILFFDFLSILSTNLILFSLLWAFSYYLARISWVDFFWSFSIGSWSFMHILDSSQILQSPGFLVLSSLCFIWSLRLSLHLFLRLKSDPKEDRRYEEIKKASKKTWALKSYFIFLMNSMLVSLLLIPQRVLALDPYAPFHSLQVTGAIICLISILGESVADFQLKKHLQTHKGKTCQNGLWRYSRHPNYFFEWLFWVGVFFCALPSTYGLWALSAPVLMFVFLYFFTGIKISEKNAELRRKDFAEYKRKTSAFFLLVPKKD